MFDENTKILGIFAHREDHIVCGWPIFQNKVPRKFLVTCTGDGMVPFLKSCKNEHISCFRRVGLPNNFSCIGPGLKPAFAMKQIRAVIQEAVRVIEPDFIFTHNPYGEYGHYDHRNLFDLVCETFPNKRIFITDIVAKSNCTPLSNLKLVAYDKLYSQLFDEVKPDKEFYKRNAIMFAAHFMWTKNKYLNLPVYPVNSARLYLV